ncbi:MAG: transcription antitermination factor NusB [Deltaproteobacteria bacterium]|nr:transcription antitermination factor NusB [Deltaproteobacteria bacterium]
MTTRRRAREVVLQMLFQLEASGNSPQQVISSFKSSFGDSELPDDYSNKFFNSIAGDIPSLDDTIKKASDNWRLERMSRVDRNIMRMGVFELIFEPETPIKIVINEAVELAKKFGTEESASFVNGVLDRIAKEKKDK